MQELSKEQIDLLRSPLPNEAISQHPTKPYLSSIKAIYVVERLNAVFGIGKWKVSNEIISTANSMIVVKATFKVEDYGIELEQFGGNDNGGEESKNFDLGDAYKGACTDALTKIASYLEIGIDVFKGKHREYGSTTNENLPTKQWLNKTSPFYKNAVTFLKNGGTLEKIKEKYLLSKEMEKDLLTQKNQC